MPPETFTFKIVDVIICISADRVVATAIIFGSIMSKVLDGKWLGALVQKQIKATVDKESARRGRAPGLAVILVGDNPASKTYVANKERAAAACGFVAFDAKLGAQASEAEIAAVIQKFNNDSKVDGILLQLPLPKGLNEKKLLDLIDSRKDADGLHPTNQGLLMRGEGRLRSCTPLGAMLLLDLAFSEAASGDASAQLSDIRPADLSGKRAIVIGRSILVGKPVALMLLERNATVTMAHSRTKDLPAVTREADIVIAAVGVPELVKGDWIKPGAIVIDVGINRTAAGTLVGDVDYAECSRNASAITPVPGGVGPMTVTMLMKNTLESYLGNADARGESL